MLLDLGRNDVGRVSRTATVKVTDQFFIERFSQVMHIVSNVEGKLDTKYDALDALAAGFPAGTVSGAPKVRAMEVIDELEKEKRGLYAGSVGYFSAAGELDSCIILRTALIKDGMMYVQAGAGIVADSNPKSEQQECVDKAKALFRAAEEAKRLRARRTRDSQAAFTKASFVSRMQRDECEPNRAARMGGDTQRQPKSTRPDQLPRCRACA
jgi:anthranilate synthase component I